MFAFGLNVNRKYFNQSLRLLWEELNDAAASQHCAGARNCLHKSPTQPQAPRPVNPMEVMEVMEVKLLQVNIALEPGTTFTRVPPPAPGPQSCRVCVVNPAEFQK